MPLFDIYIAIDFSGSKDTGRQKATIAFAELERGSSPQSFVNQFTRFDAVWYLMQRIFHHNSNGRRVLCGFDFSYAFPQGFWNVLTGEHEKWMDMIKGMAEGIANLPAIVDKPESNARKWAELANRKIVRNVETRIGPFWGPGFTQTTDPKFSYSKTKFAEYRAVEKRDSGFKPIFKIGGQGAVGLQSLCGIPYLHHLKTTCTQQKVDLHCWPFDGWETNGYAHLLVEWYPALYNSEKKTHESDALACVKWAAEQDTNDLLRDYLIPDISEKDRDQASIEGWVLGIL